MRIEEQRRHEHEAVREKVGFFDFAHDILEVTGEESAEFLDYIFVNEIADMEPNTASYTTMLNEKSDALDDVIVFYHGGDKYWITTLFMEELLVWLKAHRGRRDVNFYDITEETALYSVQGPESNKVLNKMLKDNVDDLGYFEFKETMFDDIKVMVSRTGFTGELGYELYFNPRFTDRIIEGLKENGEKYGIVEVTSDVTLTSLPTEKGYITVDDFKGANPIELGLAWSVDCDKDFIGKGELCVLKEEGPERKLVGFIAEDMDAKIEKGDKVKLQGEEIGEVTTFTYGFTVEKNIGYAMVDGKVNENQGQTVTIETYDGDFDATLHERMFYDPKGERVRA